MNKNVILVPKSLYRTTQWSGGRTTELLIFPSTSKYSDRNFHWRISSATIEVEESEFTHLPNIARHIMIIEGRITLQHQHKYEKFLEPFDQDFFMGDWDTKSLGKATDFNLMLAEGYTGSLSALSLKAATEIDIILDKNKNTSFTQVFYVVKGILDINVIGEKYRASEGDLIYISDLFDEDECKVTLLNRSKQEIVIIRAEIYPIR